MGKSSSAMRLLRWVVQCVALLLLTPAAAVLGEVINLAQSGTYGYTKIYDITSKIAVGMTTWDGDKGMPEEKLRFIDTNGESVYKFSTHMGTHSDASCHVFSNMSSYDANSLNLETLNGLALVMDAPRNKDLTAEVLKSMNIPKGVKRLLFRTENTHSLMLQPAFARDYVALNTDGAEWLVENTDIKLIGMDYLSVSVMEETKQVHEVLLKRGDLIPVEGLVLNDVSPGEYMLHCAPLRIPGADGSPTRCILTQ
ncbi:kynurenine formamidase-like [Olea europaea subsp. europaea]|uniref:Kynurenine formamidase-like n=1 Tax=Olea europaea subsp. europaea TaxID=158383 RepID=A0A8S0QAM2_OLEEU|nr:kynurenine formamidase-like [Olea europaea subsp. europaea]